MSFSASRCMSTLSFQSQFLNYAFNMYLFLFLFYFTLANQIWNFLGIPRIILRIPRILFLGIPWNSLEFLGIPRNGGVSFHGKFGLGILRNS